MEGDALYAAAVRQRPAVQRAVVNAFAAQRHAGFTKMDAYLMRAASFQPAFDKRVSAPFFKNTDMRDRSLALAGHGGTAAAAVAAVAHQPRFDPSLFGPAAHYAAVDPFDRVGAELPTEMAFGLDRPCKHHQTARVFIEPMHGTHFCLLGALTLPCSLRQQPWQQIGQSRWQETLAARAKLGCFLGMAHGRQPCRLVHNDNVLVGIADDRLRTLHSLFAHDLPQRSWPRHPAARARLHVVANLTVWRTRSHLPCPAVWHPAIPLP